MHLEFSDEEVQEASRAATSRLAISLDQPVGQDDTALGDLMAATGPNEQPEDLLALPGLIQVLPERERTVIVLRFFEDLDQYAIAARSAVRRCTCRGCYAAHSPGCTTNWWNPDPKRWLL
jgi:RNA polymerase sigma-B factor